MPEEINNQEPAEYRSGLWISLAIGLVLLVGLIALGGCSKNSANSNTKQSPGTVVRNSIGMEFAYVPAGSFQMGSSNSDQKGTPIHQVTFANGFYMGRYEVTAAQWQKVMGSAPKYGTCGENCPVNGVSWDGAQEFIKKLNAANDGYTYHLPSEAEWEYAARAGTTGDNLGDVDSMAWYGKNSGEKTHPVGQKKPNAWGLYDMYGSEQEWVMDYFHFHYDGAPTDGSAWLTGGDTDFRTLRGGWYRSDVEYLSRRDQLKPDADVLSVGFRVVAVPQSK